MKNVIIIFVIVLVLLLVFPASTVTAGTYKSLTLGVKNKNPLNIKKGGTTDWLGTVGYDSQGHAIFSSFVYGIRAAIKDIKGKISRGIDTIQELIYVWAMGNREPYITYLVNQTGYSRNQKLEFSKTTIQRLVIAMGQFESTYTISQSEFNSAWLLVV
ncbi:hypothetical protein [Flectobacillus roseus]|uniref:hypothetical protein n=1 Tax=Flectobacillus roseus TaxID=502259 RepID=UPI0024B77717|nr:hypothetical protein [Flectobacillus roseus]MDI9872236.1 hypothetical protein [Flectobacillus roseus]